MTVKGVLHAINQLLDSFAVFVFTVEDYESI